MGVRILVTNLQVDFFSPVLNMGETLAISHLSGKIPLCNYESKIRIKGFLIRS